MAFEGGSNIKRMFTKTLEICGEHLRNLGTYLASCVRLTGLSESCSKQSWVQYPTDPGA